MRLVSEENPEDWLDMLLPPCSLYILRYQDTVGMGRLPVCLPAPAGLYPVGSTAWGAESPWS